MSGDNAYASFFSLEKEGECTVVKTFSPFDGSCDSLVVVAPLKSVICMSTGSVAAFSAIGASEVVSGVSGVRFVSDSLIRSRRPEVAEVGYDASPDYEKIVSLDPDVVLAYTTSAVQPAYIPKLESMGIKVLRLYDFLEDHPLARAEYIRLHAALAGREEAGDSLFNAVASRYEALSSMASGSAAKRVLLNTPYADQWFIPGLDNYFSAIVEDAGGIILGASAGRESSVISVEKALSLSSEADFWLNPGSAGSIEDLEAMHPLFREFPVVSRERAVFNNILRTTPEGGNDFWESGAVRPDLILEDLIRILHPELLPEGELHYYIELH